MLFALVGWSIKRGNNVAGKGRPGKKQTGCVLTATRGRGWQSREIKLKELKHKGHIALGK
jgi:hypothetical protein